MKLTVKVTNDFFLDAGTIIEDMEAVHILPPQPSLFRQLCTWLGEHPVPTIDYTDWAMGIGATALCIRWGTYLAVLTDETKPIDSQAINESTSMVSDSEMKRINIEASSNFALLLEQFDQDPIRTKELLLRAYEWLPMPQKRVKCNHDTYKPILLDLLRAAHSFQSKAIEQAQIVVNHPYRALANMVICYIYRMGPIESCHGGFDAAFSLTCRRFTSDQLKTVMRFSAQQMSGVLDICKVINEPLIPLPAWPQRAAWLTQTQFYPSTWSLTESCSIIQIQKEFTTPVDALHMHNRGVVPN